MKVPEIRRRKYSSGFQAQIILRPHFKQQFFGLIVNFGSSDPQAIPGSAHFLEHKLFAKPDGDISQRFEQLGADVNAFTSFNETMFYCTGLKHYHQLISLLFRLVGQPYFTAENVQQERPIIEQELTMYQDEPSWQIDHCLMQALFGKSNLGLDVAGSQESLPKIKARDLARVYRQNYLPGKIQFVACGAFSTYQVQEIFRLCDQLQKKYWQAYTKPTFSAHQEQGQMKQYILPCKTRSHLFGIGLSLPNFKKILSSRDLAQIILQIMLESKLSVLTPWFEKMKEANLLHNPLQITVNYTRQGNFATVLGISSHSKQAIAQIEKEIIRPVSQEELVFMNNFLEWQKKEWLAQNIRSMDNLPSLATVKAEESLMGEDGVRNLRNLQTLNLQRFLRASQSLLRQCQFCSAYIEGKKLGK